ncbi:MAG TPA: hypothetical protein VKU00_05305 [Chthonomonadaceae bacterium]|nr:hypothetical protein [Chthonomonadaceae bacterium]
MNRKLSTPAVVIGILAAIVLFWVLPHNDKVARSILFIPIMLSAFAIFFGVTIVCLWRFIAHVWRQNTRM